jgi:hypothetical protein
VSLPLQEETQVEIAAKELYLLGSIKAGHIEFHGPTMHPFLQDGDELVVEPVEWNQIRVGDIITYRLEDKFPTCRVARKTPSFLSLKADNWPAFQADVGKDDVIGKVVRRNRSGSVLCHDDWRWPLHSRLVTAKERFVKIRFAAGTIKRRIRVKLRRT